MNPMEQLYQEVILDHARQKHGFGLLDPCQGSSFQVNPTCGDEVTFRLNLSDDGATITDYAWDGDGCSISRASLSVMCQLINDDPSVESIEKLSKQFHELMNSRGKVDAEIDELEDANAFVGVAKFPARIKCALLGWAALKDAIIQARATGTNAGETE